MLFGVDDDLLVDVIVIFSHSLSTSQQFWLQLDPVFVLSLKQYFEQTVWVSANEI